MENQAIAGQIEFDHFGWRYFNKIKKKAMEQEFSWSGLLLSMSIAFFVVILTAFCLNFLYTSVKTASAQGKAGHNRIYLLENTQNYLQVDVFGQGKIKNLPNIYIA
ncbi:MAG: hypothetical protein U9R06_02720 [Patescibacteria group bacterium]|nr:hypothetical protein [Patescibacteria group bacterium]